MVICLSFFTVHFHFAKTTMTFRLLLGLIVTAILITLSVLIIRLRTSSLPQTPKKPLHLDRMSNSPELAQVSKNLASALPDSVIFPRDVAVFRESMNSYWAKQECEVVPACILRPRDVQQLSTAVTILKREYDERELEGGNEKAEGLFAIRSGGHSPVPGAASTKGGVLIDLSLFCEVTPSEDGTSVVIGTGAKWMDVSKALDEKSLAIVGGRNSAVGVGGLTLGGKLLLFTFVFTFLSYIEGESETQDLCQQLHHFINLDLTQQINRRAFLLFPAVWPSLLQYSLL